jgi:hypothetical protein
MRKPKDLNPMERTAAIVDTLNAISVVARRLALNLTRLQYIPL